MQGQRIALLDAAVEADRLGALLEAQGYWVERLASVSAAQGLIDEPPDLLIAADQLPDGSGLEVVAGLRNLYGSDRLPVILLSWEDDEAVLLRGFAAGADDVLIRPIGAGVLLAKSSVLLRRRADPPDDDPYGLPPDDLRVVDDVAFGRYRPLHHLGTGSYGAVYAATDLVTDQPVALKVLLVGPAAQPEVRLRFLRECYALSSVHHPHLAGVVDFGSGDGQLYLAMQRIEGPTLTSYTRSRGPLEEDELIGMLLALAGALACLEAMQLLHRDIKPSNILLRGGDPSDPVLVDFGLAKRHFDRGITSPGVLMGTPGYLPPEALHEDVLDHRADLFALGMVARYALVGEDPYPLLPAFEVLRRMNERAPEVPESVSPPLRAVLMRLIATDPAERTGSGRALEQELRALRRVGSRGRSAEWPGS